MIAEVDVSYFELYEKIEEVISVLMQNLKILDHRILRYEKLLKMNSKLI